LTAFLRALWKKEKRPDTTPASLQQHNKFFVELLTSVVQLKLAYTNPRFWLVTRCGYGPSPGKNAEN